MKKRLLAIIFIFLVIGIILGLRNGYYEEEYEATDISIRLDSENDISQKILGNGYELVEFKIAISDMELYEDSIIYVYLTKSSRNITDDNVLEELHLSGEEISNGELTCLFDKVSMTYDRDYYIIIKYNQPDNKGYIDFNMGEGISTCPSYGNDIKYVNPLAYDMECVTGNTSMFFLWKFVFVFVTITLAYAIYRKIPFIKSMAVVILGTDVLIYVSGFFNNLLFGYYLCLILAFIMMVYIIVKIVKTDDESVEAFYQDNIRNQIWIWLIITALCMVASRGKSAIDADVLVQWGLSVKNMYVFGKFPVHEMSNVVSYRYPPLYPIFQYFCMRLYGHWSESILYFGKYFMMLSIITSCCSYKRIKGFVGIVALTLIGICVPEVFFDSGVSYSLYADEVLGIILGYALICTYRIVWKNENIKFELFVAMLSLGLTKESGLILGFLIVVSVLVVRNCYSIKQDKRLSVERRMTFTSVGAITLAFVPWQIYLKVYRGLVSFGVSIINRKEDVYLASADNSTIINMMPSAKNIDGNILMSSIFRTSGLSIQKILEYITGKAEAYKYNIIAIHLKKLMFGEYYEIANMTLPFVICFAIIIFIIYAISKKTNGQLIYTLTLIALGYVMFLQVVYTFTMTEGEAYLIASEERYLGTFLTGILMLAIYLVIAGVEPDYYKKKEMLLYSVIVSMVLIISTNCAYCFRSSILETENIYDKDDAIRDDAVKLRKYLDEGDTVYILCEGSGYYMYYNYMLLPVKNSQHTFPTDETVWKSIFDIEPEQLLNNMKKYKYIYLRISNDGFDEKYSQLFANPEDIENTSLYSFGNDGLLHKVY